VPVAPANGGPRGPIVDMPVALWRPGEPLAAFDLVSKKWVPIPAEEP
jgi:hypothetical protein